MFVPDNCPAGKFANDGKCLGKYTLVSPIRIIYIRAAAISSSGGSDREGGRGRVEVGRELSLQQVVVGLTCGWNIFSKECSQTPTLS